MSDPKLYTEREVRERERAAFANGASWLKTMQIRKWSSDAGAAWFCNSEWQYEARLRYPITRKVPREVWLDGALAPASIRSERQTVPTVALPNGRTDLSAEDIAKLADLIANPYEEVTE